MADPFDSVGAVKALLLAKVPDLKARVQEAAELAELLRQATLPSAPVFAWVVPEGLRPRSGGDAAAGAFVQTIDERIGVVLALRTAGDASGAKTLPRLNLLVWQIIWAVSGQDDGPGGDATGVFAFAGSQLVSADAGLLVYRLEFSISLQIRT